MDNPTQATPSVPPSPDAATVQQSSFSLDDAPGGFDAAFNTLTDGAPPQPIEAAPASPPAQPEPSPSDYFLRAGSSVYKTADEAARGIEHKDTLIASLRQRYISEHGIDPITNQAVSQQKPAPQGKPSYLDSTDRFFEDLVGAVQTNNRAAYKDAFVALTREVMKKDFDPYRQVLDQVAQQNALQETQKLNPEVPQFVGSANYKTVLESFPSLRGAVERAAVDPSLQTMLPELYRLAYAAHLMQSRPAQAATSVARPPVTPVRPTTSGTSVPPPASLSSKPDMSTLEGIQAYIKQAEAKGIDRLTW
jgi:hypothetical protein